MSGFSEFYAAFIPVRTGPTKMACSVLLILVLMCVPALAYHWDFGDGTTDEGRHVTHAYTTAGRHTVRLVVDGVDAVPMEKVAAVAVSGAVALSPPTRYPGND
jgi:hypothetical protein